MLSAIWHYCNSNLANSNIILLVCFKCGGPFLSDTVIFLGDYYYAAYYTGGILSQEMLSAGHNRGKTTPLSILSQEMLSAGHNRGKITPLSILSQEMLSAGHNRGKTTPLAILWDMIIVARKRDSCGWHQAECPGE